MSEKENASFLRMIGLDEELESSPSIESSVEGSTEPSYEDFDIEADAYETADLPEDSQATIKDESIEDESTEDEVLGSQEYLEEVSEKVWRQTDLSPNEIFDEISDEVDLDSRTAVYSEKEFEKVIERPLSKEYEKADRLLEGLENASASRATDIFAKSFRADSRQTSGKPQEKDIFENFDEDSFVEDLYAESGFESNSDFKVLQESSNGTATIEDEDFVEGTARLSSPERRTQAFEYEDTSDIKLNSEEVQLDPVQRIFLLEGPANRADVELNRFPIKFGRDPSNHLVIDDSNVSRHHAEIRREPQGLRLVDLGSANGMKVNGALVLEHYLRDHDLIQIGDSIFEFVEAGSSLRGLSASSASAGETQVLTKAQAKQTEARFKILPSSLQKMDRSKRLKVLAALILVLGAIYFLTESDVKQDLQQAATEQILKQADDQYLRLRNLIEVEEGVSVSEVSDERVKEIALQEMSRIPFIPDDLKARIENYPPEVFKLFAENPALYTELREENFNFNRLLQLTAREFKKAFDARDFQRARRLNEALLTFSPNNQTLLDYKKELEQETQAVRLDSPGGESSGEISEQDALKFESYMTDFQNQVQTMVDAGQFAQAVDFAAKVKAAIMELINENSAYQRMAGSAIAEWTAKEKFLKERLEEKNDKREMLQEKVIQGDQLILEIRSKMMAGQIAEASTLVEKFFREYPDHPDLQLVQSFRTEIDAATSIAFEAMKKEVEALSSDEKFQPAWEKLYAFLDLVPNYPLALRIRQELIAQTNMRGAQFYNQARVFEYETNDLVAAEQFYKKSLETADPRSELSEKASRRLREVQQKMAK